MEIFKDIIGYEKKFQIGNKGTVKRLSYKSKNRHGEYMIKKKIKKPSLTNYGYYVISLKGKVYLLHRLIAIAFIKNPNNFPCINHIDGNKLNNELNNLEWCTKAMNNKHAYDNNLKIGYWKNKKGSKHHSSKTVIQLDLNNNIIAKFGSASEAARELNLSQPQISKCCRKETKKYKKYKWEYINALQS